MTPDRRTGHYAMIAAGLTVAFQLAGKATRDALFLSTFGVAALPRMMIVSAVVSVAVAFGLTRLLARAGPGRLIPRLFWLSGLLLLAEWALAGPARPAAAVLFYLHFGGLGALLVSGFWALVNERFDPRTARGAVGRITIGASVGGLLGGLLPERVGATLDLPIMLPLLAALHLAAGLVVLWLRRATTPQEPSAPRGEARPGSTRGVFLASPYLQGIALLVVLVATAEGLLDYVFKAAATSAAADGTALLRLFAGFYTGTTLLTIAVQALMLRPLMERVGIARSAALLPGGAALGAAGALLVPGFGPLIAARAIEVVLHNSMFRAAYELLFTPVSPADKRATKLMLDVAMSRVGDIVAGVLVQTALLVGLAAAPRILLATVTLSAAALLVARRLHLGYVTALEQNLHRRAAGMPPPDVEPGATMLQSFGAIDLTALRESGSVEAVTEEAVSTAPAPPIQGEGLASSDPEQVRAALERGPLAPDQVGQVVNLLAWDGVAPQAMQALLPFASADPGRLVWHLLDPAEDFAIRRRLVRVLAEGAGPGAFEGLLRALDDPRFEVRYRAGRALARLASRHPSLAADPERVIAVVLREVAVGRGVWEGRRLIDEADDDWSPMEAEVLRDRATRSLEHVFTLLSLFLPAETLRLAFHGLHTGDPHLRGTALEYLASALPEPVRERLWPFLELGQRRTGRHLSPEAALQELLASRESIVFALGVARDRGRQAGPGT